MLCLTLAEYPYLWQKEKKSGKLKKNNVKTENYFQMIIIVTSEITFPRLLFFLYPKWHFSEEKSELILNIFLYFSILLEFRDSII